MTTEQEPGAAREISAADPAGAGQPAEEPAGAPAPGAAGQAATYAPAAVEPVPASEPVAAHATAPDLPKAQATCVDRHAFQPPVSRAALAAEILLRFEDWYGEWSPDALEECLLTRRWSP